MVVRLKDIAAELGVSVVTVSRALRNRPDIAEDTKTKILERIKRLNYRPNLTARSLVTGRSSLIGLVVPDLIHPFFAEIAKGLSAKLREKEYYLIVSSSESDGQLEQDEIEHMLSHHLDCFVVASCQKDPGTLRRIGEAGVPLVLIDRGFPGFACNFVGVDDFKVGELATEHLIAQSCRRIAHIRGPATKVGNLRAEGYSAAFRNFDVQKQKTKLMQLDVAASERVKVPAGEFEAFRVELSSAEGGPDKSTIWIAKETRTPVKMSTLMPEMGGATLTAELVP